MTTKREKMLQKIKILEQKITQFQVEISKCKTELSNFDKAELYKAVTQNGLTVEKAIAIISKPPQQNNRIMENKNEEII
jgi:hypothetical protein